MQMSNGQAGVGYQALFPVSPKDAYKDGWPINLGPEYAFEETAGRMDIVTALPGQVTKIRAKFVKIGDNYVWHCHILSHEDNEMMRRLQVLKKIK